MKKISKKILAGFMVIVLMGGIIGAKNDAYAEEDTQNIETGETQSDEQQTGTTEEDNLDEAEANKENDLKEQEDNVELEQEKEKLIGTDENGEVYEISSESGLVEQEEDIDGMARSSSAKIVKLLRLIMKLKPVYRDIHVVHMVQMQHILEQLMVK